MIQVETNGLSDLTWGDDSEHAEDSAESEIGKEEEEEEEAAAMAEGSSKRKREMDPDNDVASKRVCVP